MNGHHSNWHRVSRDRPCPVCGKADWCLVSPDGRAAICPRIEAGSTKRCGEAGWLHRLDDGFRQPRRDVPPPERAPASTKDFGEFGERFRRNADQAVRDLAQQLGVSSQALDELGVGWALPVRCWTVPEKDGTGKVVGLMRRWIDGTKMRVQGSKSGLTYAPAWDAGNGPILLVEGASDTAAAMTIGLSAVGRPSNRGGCAYLAELLESLPFEREIVVVGERDQKDSGEWPGRDGAIATAKELARRLKRPIEWCLVPDGAKDLRAWLNRFPHASPASLQEVFLEGLDRQTITPPPTVRVPLATAPAVSLDDYREQMVAARLASLDRPGVYLDRSPTGSGKSHVDRQVIAHMLLGVEVG
jgi:hypothetical protein